LHEHPLGLSDLVVIYLASYSSSSISKIAPQYSVLERYTLCARPAADKKEKLKKIINQEHPFFQDLTRTKTERSKKTMNKALNMGKISATGSFQLFIGRASSTMIMAVGTIVLTRLMLPEEYGLYSIALMPSLMISLFQDWGVNSAMTKYIASFIAKNKDNDVQDFLVAGLAFETATGLALSLLSLLLANFIATTIFHRPESALLISIASVTIFSGSLLKTSKSSFVGFEKMQFNSLTMICQSIVKSVAAPLLVFLGYGALGAVLGYTFAFLAAGIIGIATLYFIFFRHGNRTKTNRNRLFQTLKAMLHYGIPLSISLILEGFLVQFYGFMMAFFCSDIMIGNYHAATNFAVLLTFFTFPISTVLFPAFAKLNPKNEHHLLKNVFTSSVKYTALLLVPATMAVMALSKPMISTLFGEKWVYAPFFLTLYVTNNLFVVFGNIIMSSLLIGLGETKMLMKLSLLTLSIGLTLAFLLIPTLGIVGVILASIFAALPSMFLGLHWIWKRYETKADFKYSTKIFVASAIAVVTTYASLNFLNIADLMELLTGGIIFLVAYVLAAPIIGAVNQSDINNLRAMFSGLGIISKLINVPLIIAEKIAQIYYPSQINL
jgi:O-antigen/teichoic acid export membrane protein